MTSPLENLYTENDSTEPVFAQPSLVSTVEHASDPLLVSAWEVLPPELFEEGEVSELEDQLELHSADSDRAISEDQNYRETVRGVHAFMGWNHILDFEYSLATRAGNG